MLQNRHNDFTGRFSRKGTTVQNQLEQHYTEAPEIRSTIDRLPAYLADPFTAAEHEIYEWFAENRIGGGSDG